MYIQATVKLRENVMFFVIGKYITIFFTKKCNNKLLIKYNLNITIMKKSFRISKNSDLQQALFLTILRHGIHVSLEH